MREELKNIEIKGRFIKSNVFKVLESYEIIFIFRRIIFIKKIDVLFIIN